MSYPSKLRTSRINYLSQASTSTNQILPRILPSAAATLTRTVLLTRYTRFPTSTQTFCSHESENCSTIRANRITLSILKVVRVSREVYRRCQNNSIWITSSARPLMISQLLGEFECPSLNVNHQMSIYRAPYPSNFSSLSLFIEEVSHHFNHQMTTLLNPEMHVGHTRRYAHQQHPNERIYRDCQFWFAALRHPLWAFHKERPTHRITFPGRLLVHPGDPVALCETSFDGAQSG